MMANPTMPDSLVNSLVRNKESGEIRRVIRDNGKNGYHISDPVAPALMYPISVKEFDEAWELFQTVEDQLRDSESIAIFDESDDRVTGAGLRSQVNLPSKDTLNQGEEAMADRQFGELNRDPFGGRATPTNRSADAADETFEDTTTTGAPVGGNEDPAEALEEDRMDPDADEADAGPVPAKRGRAKKSSSDE